eukprot:981222-Amphidinium_carterae.3
MVGAVVNGALLEYANRCCLSSLSFSITSSMLLSYHAVLHFAPRWIASIFSPQQLLQGDPQGQVDRILHVCWMVANELPYCASARSVNETMDSVNVLGCPGGSPVAVVPVVSHEGALGRHGGRLQERSLQTTAELSNDFVCAGGRGANPSLNMPQLGEHGSHRLLHQCATRIVICIWLEVSQSLHCQMWEGGVSGRHSVLLIALLMGIGDLSNPKLVVVECHCGLDCCRLETLTNCWAGAEAPSASLTPLHTMPKLHAEVMREDEKSSLRASSRLNAPVIRATLDERKCHDAKVE